MVQDAHGNHYVEGFIREWQDLPVVPGELCSRDFSLGFDQHFVGNVNTVKLLDARCEIAIGSASSTTYVEELESLQRAEERTHEVLEYFNFTTGVEGRITTGEGYRAIY